MSSGIQRKVRRRWPLHKELTEFPRHYNSAAEFFGEAYQNGSIAAKQWQMP